MVSARRRLGRLAGLTVATMFVVSMSGCEVDPDFAGIGFQLPEGGGFEIPHTDGSTVDGSGEAATGQPDAPLQDEGGTDAGNEASPDASPSDGGGTDSGDGGGALDADVADAIVADVAVSDALVADVILIAVDADVDNR